MKKKSLLSLGQKTAVFLLSVLALSVAVFYLSRLAPGDPLVSFYGERVEKMSAAEKTAARSRLGLDGPLYTQYFQWLKNAVHGDFGISLKYKQDVWTVIGQRAGNTLLLGGLGFLLTFFGALGLGLLCAWKEDSWLDRVVCKVGTALSCIPEFWLSLLLLLIFAVGLGLPSSGAYDVGLKNDLLNRLEHLILPLSVVVLQHLWYYAYFVRSKLLEEMRADYVLLARAKGLGKGRIMVGHCLRNALPSYLSLMAVSVPHVLGGTYVVEAVFSYPGLGALSYESAKCHDYNLLMVLCLLTGALVILCNLIGRSINARVDPRFREEVGQA